MLEHLNEKIRKKKDELRYLSEIKHSLFGYLEGGTESLSERLEKAKTNEINKMTENIAETKDLIKSLYKDLINEFKRLANILFKNKDLLVSKILSNEPLSNIIINGEKIHYKDVISRIEKLCDSSYQEKIDMIDNEEIEFQKKITELGSEIQGMKNIFDLYDIDYR
ncbi:hypothetical protein [Fusobacterium sp. PH5-44]|uniref:hypothetical protein n=1 Tax=unclassified Fusobacterium TaxID=2648384 RepID=UPI003D262DEB